MNLAHADSSIALRAPVTIVTRATLARHRTRSICSPKAADLDADLPLPGTAMTTTPASVSAAASSGDAPASQARPSPRAEAASSRAAVVLVHGAFADGSSWHKVIPLLQAAGLDVVAVQNPLTSLADDVAFARRAIDAQRGPVVLVGHSWGGSVISEAGEHDRVKALVYVAAFAPEAGEASSDLGKRFPATPGKEGRITSPDGFQTLSPEAVRDNFAQDLPEDEANLIAITQGAVRADNFGEPLTRAAWRSKPSWYVVAAQDRMIHPDAQRAFARRAGATTTELPSSHVPMLSKPREVADVIIAASRNLV
jgi:pimeloyl-ACP methyl ester carboxylesterase